MMARDGTVVWFHDEAVLLKDEGNLRVVQGVLLDVTEADAKRLGAADAVALRDPGGLLALLRREEEYGYDKARYAKDWAWAEGESLEARAFRIVQSSPSKVWPEIASGSASPMARSCAAAVST
jgi:hypothetical protein